MARPPLGANVELGRWTGNPNDFPMFTSRRFSRPDYPWPGFVSQALEECAAQWLELYPALAAEGRGSDPAYTEWYAAMLTATAPTGLLAAAHYWEPPPGYMYVMCGPAGVDRFPLPPPGRASNA